MGVYFETLSGDLEAVYVANKKPGIKRCFTFKKNIKLFLYKEIDKNRKILKEEKIKYDEVINAKTHLYKKRKYKRTSFSNIMEQELNGKKN